VIGSPLFGKIASCNREFKILKSEILRGILAQLVERLNGIEEGQVPVAGVMPRSD
jgi:hypothetical protein